MYLTMNEKKALNAIIECYHDAGDGRVFISPAEVSKRSSIAPRTIAMVLAQLNDVQNMYVANKWGKKVWEVSMTDR